MMNVIQIENLSYTRSKRTIFNSFTVDIQRGQFVALLGPNGTGKSTLLKLISGILPTTQGSVQLFDKQLTQLKAIERAKIVSYMPQFSQLQTEFTVEQVVSMGRYPHKKRFEAWTSEDKAKVNAAMERTEIIHLRERYLPHLSGGERQLVYLAKAIAQDTPILLLDEPTSDLDVFHQIIVMSIIKSLKEEGKTIVAAIHDINLAAREADACLLIRDGSIVSFGSQEHVIQADNMLHAYHVKSHIFKEPITETKQTLPYEAVK